MLFPAIIIGVGFVWWGHVSSNNLLIGVPAYNPSITEPQSEGILKQDFIKLNTDVLQEIRFRQKRARLDVLDEGLIEIQIDRREMVDDKTSILHGHVFGQPESQVVLAVAGVGRKKTEALVGTITLDSGRVFRIDYLGKNIHRLGEVDPAFGQYSNQGVPEFGQNRGPDGKSVQWAYQYVQTSSGKDRGNPGHSVAFERGMYRQQGKSPSRLSLRMPGRLFAQRDMAAEDAPVAHPQ